MKSTLLIDAAKAGDLEAVENLLRTGAKVNETDYYGATALIVAARKGHVEIVDKLISAGANVNAACIDTTQFSRLKGGVLNRLLKNSRKYRDDKDARYGMTALMGAASNGHAEIVERLIAAKADVNYANFYGETALGYAVSAGRFYGMGAVDQLLLAGANVNPVVRYCSPPLFKAIFFGNVLMVQRLLAAGAYVNYVDRDGATALFVAVSRDNNFMVKLLIMNGINVHHLRRVKYPGRYGEENHTALSWAVELENTRAKYFANERRRKSRTNVVMESSEDSEDIENPGAPQGIENLEAPVNMMEAEVLEDLDDSDSLEGLENLEDMQDIENLQEIENPQGVEIPVDIIEAEVLEGVRPPWDIKGLEYLKDVVNMSVIEVIKSALPLKKDLDVARNKGSVFGFFHKNLPELVSERIVSFLDENNQLMFTTRAAYRFAKEQMSEHAARFADAGMTFHLFQKRYFDAYDQEFFKKENSEMFKLIKQGKIKTVDEVKAYIERKPYSRAARVYSQFVAEYFEAHASKLRLKK